MNLLNFTTQFPDEASCIARWKEYREQEGVVYPHCGNKEHYWKSDKEVYECKRCKYRQSLKSNTVMHGSQLPFRYWFIAIHLLTSTKKSFSASELQRQLDHKNYDPIWAMLHKLRQVMGNQDERYSLKGIVELDEGYFSTERPEEEKNKPVKRGRGRQKKSKVLVMAESIINSDHSTSYTNFSRLIKDHHLRVIPKKEVGTILPGVYIAISNAKRMLLDIFHDIKPEYLQNYLNEFCHKSNRIYFGEQRFDRLMIVAVEAKNQFRYNI